MFITAEVSVGFFFIIITITKNPRNQSDKGIFVLSSSKTRQVPISQVLSQCLLAAGGRRGQDVPQHGGRDGFQKLVPLMIFHQVFMKSLSRLAQQALPVQPACSKGRTRSALRLQSQRASHLMVFFSLLACFYGISWLMLAFFFFSYNIHVHCLGFYIHHCVSNHIPAK